MRAHARMWVNYMVMFRVGVIFMLRGTFKVTERVRSRRLQHGCGLPEELSESPMDSAGQDLSGKARASL